MIEFYRVRTPGPHHKNFVHLSAGRGARPPWVHRYAPDIYIIY